MARDHNFPEYLLPVAVCIYFPFIILGNSMIITTVSVIKRLHTSHDYILFAIAVNDLLIGVAICPLIFIRELPEAEHLIGSSKVSCYIKYLLEYSLYDKSLLLLTIMCVDRFCLIRYPVGYRKWVTKNRVVLGICIITIKYLCTIAMAGLEQLYWTEDTEEWTEDKCTLRNMIHGWFLYLGMADVSLEMLISFGLCCSVSFAVLKSRKQVLDNEVKLKKYRLKLNFYDRTKKMLKEELDLRREKDDMESISDEEMETKSSPNSQTVDFEKFTHDLRKKQVKRKMHATIMVSLMFAFSLFWTPSLVQVIQWDTWSDKVHRQWEIIATLFRLVNSFVNVPIYAVSRSVFRRSFRYMLTTPPHRWGDVKYQIASTRASGNKTTPSVPLTPTFKMTAASAASHLDHVKELLQRGYQGYPPAAPSPTVHCEHPTIRSSNNQYEIIIDPDPTSIQEIKLNALPGIMDKRCDLFQLSRLGHR